MATVPATTNEALMLHYQQLWDSMTTRPEWERRLIDAVHMLKNARPTYELFVLHFNPALPWQVVAAIHMMEASGDFTTHLHNGDSLKQRTIHEPKGRPLLDPLQGIGKPYMWHESAKDALRMKDWDKYHTWDLPHCLFRIECYNGRIYDHYGINTPYLWSSTNHYLKGKYVADHVFDANVVSKQIGAAAILKRLM